MANHRESEWIFKGKKVGVQPGQFITSLESIKNKCGKGISLQNVRTALKNFEKYGFITNESTKTGRLITIVNWHIYQSKLNDSNPCINNDLTKSQQTPSIELTPNNNKKNIKKNKNLYLDFVYLSDDEYKKLLKHFGSESVVFENIAVLNDNIGSKGKRYKSHYHTILSWDRKNNMDKPITEGDDFPGPNGW